MIELIIKEYLEQKLGLTVVMEKPTEPPEEYVLVEKTGSSRENLITTATVAVQSYSGSMYGAASLNKRVKQAMEDITWKDEVSRCDLDTDYNYTDTAKKEYRYQAIYSLVYFDDFQEV